MSNHRNGQRARGAAYSILATASFALVAAAFATDLAQLPQPAPSTTCQKATTTLPKRDALKLSDGEHVIAKTGTSGKTLEARTAVRSGVPSAPSYLLSGKRLSATPLSQAPSSVRQCLGTLPGREIPERTKYADGCTVTMTCNNSTPPICCTTSCCEDGCTVYCG